MILRHEDRQDLTERNETKDQLMSVRRRIWVT